MTPGASFPSLQRILFPVYISITTPLGLAQELWEDGWRPRVLSCALGPGTGKEGRLLRKRRSLEGNGASREKWGSWEGNEALGVADSECTDLRPWRREVRRPPGP